MASLPLVYGAVRSRIHQSSRIRTILDTDKSKVSLLLLGVAM